MLYPWILFRYLAWQYIRLLLFIVVIVCLIHIMLSIVDIPRGMPMLPYILGSAMKLPQLLIDFSSLIIFFTAFISFRIISSRHEFDVLKAAGFSIWQFLFPSFVCVVVLAFAIAFFLQPRASMLFISGDLYLKRVRGSHNVVSDYNTNGFWHIVHDASTLRVLYASNPSAGHGMLGHVSYLVLTQDGRFVEGFDAPIAHIQKKSLLLVDAFKTSSRYDIQPVSSISVPMVLSLLPKGGQDLGHVPRYMSAITALRFYRLRSAYGDSLPYLTQVHFLLSLPLLFIGMLLFGISFSLAQGRKIFPLATLMLAVSSCLVLYLFLNVSRVLTAAGVFPIILGIWGITAFAAILGIWRILSAGEDS